MSDNRYIVTTDETGCAECGRGEMWTVLDIETDTAIGQSFGDEADAEDLCASMNQGYCAGLRANQPSNIVDAADAINGLIGLLQLIEARSDTPADLKEIMMTNHRVVTAKEWLIEAGFGTDLERYSSLPETTS